MLVLVLSLAVLFLVALYVAAKRAAVASQTEARMRVVIVVKDQEPWVEGFLRKLFFCLASQWPEFEVQVADGGSRDQTPEMLLRLQRLYRFDLILLHEPDEMTVGDGQVNMRVVDVRGLTGHHLINAPVFSQLKAWCAGKSPDLSK